MDIKRPPDAPRFSKVTLLSARQPARSDGRQVMNYNLLWYLWFLWACALGAWLFGWRMTLLLAVIMTPIAHAAFRGSKLNKGIIMFKRKAPPASDGDVATPDMPATSEEQDQAARLFGGTMIKAAPAAITTIQESCTIVGEITAEGDVHINGSVTGKIMAQKTVVLQKQGCVDGEIYAQRTEIGGRLKGLCRSREVAVNAEGVMEGTIECESLAVHPQGRFYGSSLPWEQEKRENGLTDAPAPDGQTFQLHKATLLQP